jgi:siroheme synthase
LIAVSAAGFGLNSCREKGPPAQVGGRIHPIQVLAMRGKVFLMGAGPGDPDLLTVKAVRALRSAEVVLHDDSVAPEVLELVPASAQVRNVHKVALQAGSLQEKIHSLLISAAREGHQVVRLKAVDALPSPHSDEETEALAQAGIDFEVISGAASTMGAAAGATSR